ncbi:MAG: hypothetical protein IPF41_09215 [Flavobacteriales bacterium]|nr:hypothetical protein [Flavobacteriales bacterium]
MRQQRGHHPEQAARRDKCALDHVEKLAEIEVVKGSLSIDDLLNALKPAGYGLIAQAA